MMWNHSGAYLNKEHDGFCLGKLSLILCTWIYNNDHHTFHTTSFHQVSTKALTMCILTVY